MLPFISDVNNLTSKNMRADYMSEDGAQQSCCFKHRFKPILRYYKIYLVVYLSPIQCLRIKIYVCFTFNRCALISHLYLRLVWMESEMSDELVWQEL